MVGRKALGLSLNKERTMTQTTYVAPELSLVGKLEDVTLGTSSGNKLDNSFPTNTPANQLTFS